MRLEGSPRISILLPVWNGIRFLAPAIDSMLAQTYESFELIVIDDGSLDGSHELAAAYVTRDARVSVVRTTHRGIAPALNLGLRVALGEFIARMDCDDVSLPDRLEKQLAFLDANPQCVAVGAALALIDEDGEPLGTREFPVEHKAIVESLLNRAPNSMAHSTILMRRDAAVRAGGYDPAFYPTEDVDLWFRLLDQGELANLGEALLLYRRHTATVGVRERARQSVIWGGLVDAARARRGLRALAPLRAMEHAHRNARATYHFDCARIALGSGRRPAARRHALASARHAPRWWRPYAALAVSSLPQHAFALLMRLYDSFRSRVSQTT